MPTPAGAQVRDDGKFFSADAISRANDMISRINREYGKGLIVETYERIPTDLQDEFQRYGKNSFYGRWLDVRAKSLGLDGVFILMTKDPSHLQVGVGRATRDQEFTVADREQLREMMAAQFRNKRFDAGLQQRRPVPAPQPRDDTAR